jgi:hypothetical protein
MPQATYSVWFYDPNNTRLEVITKFVSLNYSRSVNVPGSMTLVMPSAGFNKQLLVRDARLEIWRKISNREYLETNTQWLVRKWITNDDAQTITIRAESGLELCNRRIIAYDAETSQSAKSGDADTVIVEFVNENLGAAVADSNRDWSDKITIFSASGGPTVNRAASRKNLLKTIQEVAQDAGQAGSPIFFDMEYNTGSRKFEFRTFKSIRGVDLTLGSNTLTLSNEFGSLTNVIRDDDYTNEITFAYAAGRGTAAERKVQSASDGDRINESPFGRIEKLADSRNTSASGDLIGRAQETVRDGRPVRMYSGTVVNKPGAFLQSSIYGINWNWGDKVKVELDGEVQSATIDSVSVSVQSKKETISTAIRIEDVIST